MGKNAQRRKLAKLEGHAQRPTAAVQPVNREDFLAAFGGTSSVPNGSIAASVFRRECDECGSDDIAWMSPAELAPLVDGESQARVSEAVAMFGPNAEAWRCNDCGKWGIFGPTEFGGFGD